MQGGLFDGREIGSHADTSRQLVPFWHRFLVLVPPRGNGQEQAKIPGLYLYIPNKYTCVMTVTELALQLL